VDTPKSNFDPYAAPEPSSIYHQDDSSGLTYDQQKLLKDFRSQSLALGVLWLILAAIIGGGAVALLLISWDTNEPRGTEALPAILMAVSVLLGTAYALAGAGTLMKKPWGLYVGLTLSYLGLVVNLIRVNVCGLVIVVVILIQAHRVLKFMSLLRQAGIPLTSKPNSFRKSPPVLKKKENLSDLFGQ
jgi:hypothetical protein